MHEESDVEVELAIRRVLLLYSIILAIGGIPLLYLGDEVGTLNDYSYGNDPAKAGDSRWVHRPFIDWSRVAHRRDPSTVEGRIFGALCRLIEVRKQHAVFAGEQTDFVDTGNDHVFGFVRRHNGGHVLVLANFSEREQHIVANQVRLYGLGYTFTDLVAGERVRLDGDLVLPPYHFTWLAGRVDYRAPGQMVARVPEHVKRPASIEIRRPRNVYRNDLETARW